VDRYARVGVCRRVVFVVHRCHLADLRLRCRAKLHQPARLVNGLARGPASHSCLLPGGGAGRLRAPVRRPWPPMEPLQRALLEEQLEDEDVRRIRRWGRPGVGAHDMEPALAGTSCCRCRCQVPRRARAAPSPGGAFDGRCVVLAAVAVERNCTSAAGPCQQHRVSMTVAGSSPGGQPHSVACPGRTASSAGQAALKRAASMGVGRSRRS
jgi:hypothetical protein